MKGFRRIQTVIPCDSGSVLVISYSVAKMTPFKYLILASLLTIFSELVSSQIVNTTLGLVQGLRVTSRGGRTFNAFLGIPYASSPTGNLRFADPVPATGWDGVRDATSYGPVCHQFGNYTGVDLPQDENCLNLNIYTPVNQTILGLEKNELLPVLVYVHGGYFMVLSGSNYGPKYVMDHDIIFVTMNYRLGSLGMLSTRDGNAPGNAALKDQILALKWLQDNIQNFGGDPSRVTIYGESAGAAAIHYHLLSPLSEGLFSAAISGSGTAFKVLSYLVSPLEASQKLATELGCGHAVGNATEMVNCLRSVDAKTLGESSNEFMKCRKDPLRMFAPTVEMNSSGADPFLTQHPYEIIASGSQQRVPWMVGINSAEGFVITLNILADEDCIQEINANWTKGLAEEFLLLDGDRAVNLSSSVDEFYLNTVSANGSVDFMRDLMGFTDLFSDRLYIHASLEAVKLQASHSPVYLYYNDYMTAENPLGLGTIHGEEVALLFSPGNFSDPIIDRNHPDYEQSRAMVDIWVQFVKNPQNVQYNGERWKAVNSSEGLDCLVFKNSDRGEQGFAEVPDIVKDRVRFWNDLEVNPYQKYENETT